jgi:FkbM family methyltransferase
LNLNLNALRYMQSWARGLLSEWRIRHHINDAEWRPVCRESKIPLDKIKFAPEGNLLLKLEKTTIQFPKTPAAFRILSSYSLLRELDAFTDCKVFWNDEKDALILTWGGASYLADNPEEIYILREIYLSGDYDFASADSVVVIDIGANVGFTSIFLADANPDVIIIACEPVELNFRKALRNLAENPHLSKRITPHNIGLFTEDGEQVISSEIENRGRSSIVIDRSYDSPAVTENIPVKVRRASSFIRMVRELYPDRRIIVKMDCEGSEYNILRNLKDDGVLNFISAFMMEWHNVGDGDNAAFIRDFFMNSGFDVCIRGRNQSKDTVGIAYAFRVNSDI